LHARIGGASSASPSQYSEEEGEGDKAGEEGTVSVVVSVVVVVVVVSYLAQTLSLPPTMKQPGHNLTFSFK
jgi:hypothetical protein